MEKRKDPTANVQERNGERISENEGFANLKPVGRATPEQMARKHVYVINGSPDFLDIMRELLQGEQYNVTTTNFVPLSFEGIQASRPDLLIIDLVLGERASWDLLSRLRQGSSTHDIPVLVVSISSHLLHEARKQHQAFGGDRYLVKPFDLDDLMTVIGELIGTA